MTTRKRIAKKKGVITLDMFLGSQKKDSGRSKETSKEPGSLPKQKEEQKTGEVRRTSTTTLLFKEKTKSEEKKQDAKTAEDKITVSESKNPLDILDELLSGFVKPGSEKKEKEHALLPSHKEEKKARTTTKPVSSGAISKGKEKSGRAEKSSGREKSGEQVIVASNIIPTGRILDEILNKGLTDEFLKCDNTGKCTDGRRLGEIYTDKYGFKRQRGFVRTTRTPVYVDWIVEEATISKLLPKAYKLVTSRGAVAIIPEDFLCELQERYGVIIKSDEINCRSTKL